MKKMLYLLCILYSIYSLAQSQSVITYMAHEVIYFEGITYAGGRFFGITKDRETAQQIINDYMKRNANTKHQLTYKTIKDTTLVEQSDIDVFQQFLSVCPKGYVLLPIIAYNSLYIAKKDTMESAIWYYLKTKNTTPKLAKTKVMHLSKMYGNYINLL